ncbi:MULTISPECIES: membrane protein insertion efficiency factor YidD [unclassified Gordonia (in: high G+C Gram-positive bacteria)]
MTAPTTSEHETVTPAPGWRRALSTTARWLHLLPRRIVIFLVELYRTWVSPLRLPTCRFEPTCSGYAVEALERHGFFYGGTLAVIRLLKCGPWHKPGYDPVPEQKIRWPSSSRTTSHTNQSSCTTREHHTHRGAANGSKG